MKKILFVLICLLLAGCTRPEHSKDVWDMQGCAYLLTIHDSNTPTINNWVTNSLDDGRITGQRIVKVSRHPESDKNTCITAPTKS